MAGLLALKTYRYFVSVVNFRLSLYGRWRAKTFVLKWAILNWNFWKYAVFMFSKANLSGHYSHLGVNGLTIQVHTKPPALRVLFHCRTSGWSVRLDLIVPSGHGTRIGQHATFYIKPGSTLGLKRLRGQVQPLTDGFGCFCAASFGFQYWRARSSAEGNPQQHMSEVGEK